MAPVTYISCWLKIHTVKVRLVGGGLFLLIIMISIEKYSVKLVNSKKNIVINLHQINYDLESAFHCLNYWIFFAGLFIYECIFSIEYFDSQLIRL